MTDKEIFDIAIEISGINISRKWTSDQETARKTFIIGYIMASRNISLKETIPLARELDTTYWKLWKTERNI